MNDQIINRTSIMVMALVQPYIAGAPQSRRPRSFAARRRRKPNFQILTQNPQAFLPVIRIRRREIGVHRHPDAESHRAVAPVLHQRRQNPALQLLIVLRPHSRHGEIEPETLRFAHHEGLHRRDSQQGVIVEDRRHAVVEIDVDLHVDVGDPHPHAPAPRQRRVRRREIGDADGSDFEVGNGGAEE